MLTRVVYDNLPEGTHTWCYAEAPFEHRICPDHGVQATKAASADGAPRADLPTVCPAPITNPTEGGIRACGLTLASETYPEITGEELDAQLRPWVGPGAILEVADLHHPKSDRARIIRDHLARGYCHVVNDPAQPAPAEG